MGIFGSHRFRRSANTFRVQIPSTYAWSNPYFNSGAERYRKHLRDLYGKGVNSDSELRNFLHTVNGLSRQDSSQIFLIFVPFRTDPNGAKIRKTWDARICIRYAPKRPRSVEKPLSS
jgi:hypothetical protein